MPVIRQWTFCLLIAFFCLTGCGEQRSIHHILREVGPANLRRETIEVCGTAFNANAAQKIPNELWPASARSFQPLGLWAEPDGAYILLDSDADGERGIFLPRIVSDKDPVCGPKLTHVKLAEGIYSYETKR